MIQSIEELIRIEERSNHTAGRHGTKPDQTTSISRVAHRGYRLGLDHAKSTLGPNDVAKFLGAQAALTFNFDIGPPAPKPNFSPEAEKEFKYSDLPVPLVNGCRLWVAGLIPDHMPSSFAHSFSSLTMHLVGVDPESSGSSKVWPSIYERLIDPLNENTVNNNPGQLSLRSTEGLNQSDIMIINGVVELTRMATIEYCEKFNWHLEDTSLIDCNNKTSSEEII